jgi:hypothetical protein
MPSLNPKKLAMIGVIASTAVCQAMALWIAEFALEGNASAPR